MSQMGQPRRLSDLGMSASPPTSDIGLRRCEPTLGATKRHVRVINSRLGKHADANARTPDVWSARGS